MLRPLTAYRQPDQVMDGAAGRLVIRPSGTEPVIRVMAEGDDEHLVASCAGDIVDAVRKDAQAA